MRLTRSSREPIGTAVARRLWSIPMMAVLAAVTTALLPAIVVVTVAVDLVRFATRRLPFPVTRMALFGWWYLVTDIAALIALFGVGLVTGFGLWRRAMVDWTFALQTWWAHQLFGGFLFLFGAKLEVEGREALETGPVVLFMRHASIADVLLPNVVVTRRHGIRLRYVLKRELLVDPALDIAGNRLPNYFVRRGTGDTREIERVAALTDDLAGTDGVIIYPEGTRFGESKRDRVLESIARRSPELLDRARRLRHVLPPQLGGPLALLDSHTPADVVFMTHVGLDGLAEVKDLYSGGLVGITIQIEFWRVPHGEIPTDRSERIDWLFDQWQRIDDWIDERTQVR